MSIAPVMQFFANKVNIQLKSGQRFEGLLSRVDYKNNLVVLEDVEDLGNEQDKDCVPHDKKIPEKQFQAQNINQIFLKEKHFSQPKKYKKEEFWDAISEPQVNKDKKPRKYEERGDNRKYEDRKDYKPRRNNEDRNYRQREDRPREDRPQRKYEQRKPQNVQQAQRQLR